MILSLSSAHTSSEQLPSIRTSCGSKGKVEERNKHEGQLIEVEWGSGKGNVWNSIGLIADGEEDVSLATRH